MARRRRRRRADGGRLAFVDSKKRIIKTHPISQLQARGWVVVVLVALKKEKKDNKNPPRLAIAGEGVGCCRCRGCRRRQTTTTSLHGSWSFAALKNSNKNATPQRKCKPRGGVLSSSW